MTEAENLTIANKNIRAQRNLKNTWNACVTAVDASEANCEAAFASILIHLNNINKYLGLHTTRSVFGLQKIRDIGLVREAKFAIQKSGEKVGEHKRLFREYVELYEKLDELFDRIKRIAEKREVTKNKYNVLKTWREQKSKEHSTKSIKK